MVSENEIYISINPDAYRVSKLNVLTNQLDLLNTLKRLQNLKVLSRRKEDIKNRILRNLSVIKTNLEILEKSVPTPKIPSILKKREKELKQPREEVFEVASRRAEIEEELLTIREKLKALNG